MRRKDSTYRYRGFTLVELLVVVGIVAVLVALLLPVVRKARVAARRAACTSNMRQTLMALTAYAVNHNEFPVNAAPGVELVVEDEQERNPFWHAPHGHGAEGV